MITIDRTFLDENGAPDEKLLASVLEKHAENRVRLDALWDFYRLRHRICERSRVRDVPNNRLVHDLPGYIVQLCAGYLVGRPVSYALKDDRGALSGVLSAFRAACSDSVDTELAHDAAIFGKGIELCYADSNARPRMAQADPREAFVVYDDTVEHAPLFGVTETSRFDRGLTETGKRVTVYTANEMICYERKSRETPREISRGRHYFGGVPLTEYWNNPRETGDFENVMSLIDAYDALQSDRVNDKQQFTDSMLVLYGIGALGAEDTEEYAEAEGELTEVPEARRDALSPAQRLRQTKTLFMPAGDAKAEYLTKQLSESDTEVLKESLRQDIHKLCFVPDMSDRDFAGNASGVAMRFKLLGLEQLTRVKERWFREGLRQRLRLFAAFLSMQGAPALDADEVQITFSRSLPVNELEVAQTVGAYRDLVPDKLLLTQVPFVEDVDEAFEMMEEERREADERRQAMFAGYPERSEGERADADRRTRPDM